MTSVETVGVLPCVAGGVGAGVTSAAGTIGSGIASCAPMPPGVGGATSSGGGGGGGGTIDVTFVALSAFLHPSCRVEVSMQYVMVPDGPVPVKYAEQQSVRLSWAVPLAKGSGSPHAVRTQTSSAPIDVSRNHLLESQQSELEPPESLRQTVGDEDLEDLDP